MNWLLIVAILAICTVRLYAQAQQPDAPELKADAQKVASTIRGDKAKSQTYCQLDSLSDQIDEAAQAKDTKKVEALSQRADELEKQLGPEYRALFDALNEADPNSKDVQDILPMFDNCLRVGRPPLAAGFRWRSGATLLRLADLQCFVHRASSKT